MISGATDPTAVSPSPTSSKTLADETKEGAKDYDKAIDCLSDYFKIKKNISMARQTLLSLKRNPG